MPSFRPRNLGRFRISSEMLINARSVEDLAGIFKDLIVLETRHAYDWGGTEYLAMGEPFEEIAEGSEAPMYEVRIDSIDGSVIWEKRE